jgi:hypothetical protein
MNVTMWEHCTFDNLIFGCGKIYIQNNDIVASTSWCYVGHPVTNKVNPPLLLI